MFEVKTSFSFDEGKLDISEQKLDNCIEFVGRTKQNNGVKGYLKQLNILPNKKDTISVSQVGTIAAQIRYNDWYASQNIFILSAIKDKRLVSRIVLSSINKMLKLTYSQGYSNYPTLSKLSDNKIQLPTKNGKIDFEFMESFIAELEAQRIAELEAYLTVTGLKDYELTEDEKNAIDMLDTISWKEENIMDIFNVNNTKSILSRDVIFNSGSTPYLCASRENNSIASYIEYSNELKDKGDCIFIGGKTFVVTYQDKDFYSNDSHNLALYLKEKESKSKTNQLFLLTCIRTALSHLYSWGNSVSKQKIKNNTILIPMCNNCLNINYMETLIRAIQKLVIKDVVCWADKKIEATKQVIEEK